MSPDTRSSLRTRHYISGRYYDNALKNRIHPLDDSRKYSFPNRYLFTVRFNHLSRGVCQQQYLKHCCYSMRGDCGLRKCVSPLTKYHHIYTYTIKVNNHFSYYGQWTGMTNHIGLCVRVTLSLIQINSDLELASSACIFNIDLQYTYTQSYTNYIHWISFVTTSIQSVHALLKLNPIVTAIFIHTQLLGLCIFSIDLDHTATILQVTK